jgi:hypothetical protein
MFYEMANRDLTKMDAVMNMPLMEFLNYAAMLKTLNRNRVERLTKAAKGDVRGYIAAMIGEMLP